MDPLSNISIIDKDGSKKLPYYLIVNMLSNMHEYSDSLMMCKMIRANWLFGKMVTDTSHYCGQFIVQLFSRSVVNGTSGGTASSSISSGSGSSSTGAISSVNSGIVDTDDDALRKLSSIISLYLDCCKTDSNLLGEMSMNGTSVLYALIDIISKNLSKIVLPIMAQLVHLLLITTNGSSDLAHELVDNTPLMVSFMSSIKTQHNLCLKNSVAGLDVKIALLCSVMMSLENQQTVVASTNKRDSFLMLIQTHIGIDVLSKCLVQFLRSPSVKQALRNTSAQESVYNRELLEECSSTFHNFKEKVVTYFLHSTISSAPGASVADLEITISGYKDLLRSQDAELKQLRSLVEATTNEDHADAILESKNKDELISSLHARLEESLMTTADTTERMHSLEKRVAELQVLLEQSRSVTSAKQSFESSTHTHSPTPSTTITPSSSSSVTHSQSNAQVSQLEKENEELKEEVWKVKETLRELREEHETLQQNHREHMSICSSLTSQSSSVSTQEVVPIDVHAKSEKELSEVKRQLVEMTDKLNAKVEFINKLEHENNEAMGQLNAEIGTLKAESRNLSNTMSRNEKEMKTYLETITKNKDTILHLEAQLSDVQEARLQLTQSYKELSNELNGCMAFLQQNLVENDIIRWCVIQLGGEDVLHKALKSVKEANSKLNNTDPS